MTPEQWERAKDIFDAALDLAPDKRAAYIHSACSNDPVVFSEVESLLAAHAEVCAIRKKADGSFLRPDRFDLMPDLFDPPPPPTPSLQTGEVISGRFRIVRQLGRGGMGEVYEAHDSELGVLVALKTLHPEIAANPEVLNRFRQEVRIAHRITHSNVCRTFHLGRDIAHVSSDGSDPVDLTFITMEVLDGKSLYQILKDTGRLPLDRAHAIAIQMAEAIEAAHRAGIIHRDIKPGNVMVCSGRNGEGDRVAVTDFGLAKVDGSAPGSDADLSAISHPGNIIGTPAYMAPEQLDLKPVSPATDIYSFGLVLYEMVTGQKAFPGSHTIGEARSRLVEEPPSPRAVFPDLPAEWDKAILSCLQIDPADRLHHVTDVIAVIEGADPAELSKSPSINTGAPPRWPAPQPQPATRRRWILPTVAILLFCVSLSWPAYRLYQWRANSTVASGTLVYLAPVKNETGEKQLDNITELVRAGLSQSAHINLLDAGRVSEILQHMTKSPDTAITPEIAREIAMRGNAPRLITGVLSKAGNTFSLAFTIEQPDNQPGRPRHSWPKTWTWNDSAVDQSSTSISPKLLENIREASDWIRGRVGESDNDIVRLGARPEDVTTGSWEALDDYEQALRLSNEGRRADAVLALQQAVQKDPQFALAYAMMGDILISLRREIEGFRAYDKALDSGLRNRLTRKEEDRIRGMRAVDTADYQLAVDAFHDYTINYKNDYIGWTYPTIPLRMLKRDEEAIANLKAAIPLAPDNSFAPHELANELILRDRQDEALQWVAYLKNHNHAESATEVEIVLAFLNHHYDDALRLTNSLHNSASLLRRSNSYGKEAGLLAEIGDYKAAIKAIDQGLVDDDAQNNSAQRAERLLNRAYLEYKLQDYSSCIRDVDTGYVLNPSPQNALKVDTILGNVYAVGPLPITSAVRLELRKVMQTLPQPEYGNLAELVQLRTLGETQLADHRPELALKTFQQADKKDELAGSREYVGRALVALIAKNDNPSNSNRLLEQAMAAYSPIALRPAFIWSNPNHFLPGEFADALSSYVGIASQLRIDSPEVRRAKLNFALLRKNQTSNLVVRTSRP